MRKTIFLLLIMLLAFTGLAEAAKRAHPEAKEFKILLKADNFLSFEQGCKLFWKLVESVALDHSVKVKKAEKEYPVREICFIDSRQFALYKHGFILRIRSEDVKNAAGRIEVSGDAEMTLKFRASDFESVQIAPVQHASQYTGEVSYEEDVVVKATAPVSVFSVSSCIFRPGSIPTDFTSLLKFYPGLQKAGFVENHPLTTVNGIFVSEKRLRLGELKFAETKAKTIFSAWYKKGATKPFVAEFSFKVNLKAKNPARRVRDLEEINKFFVDLVERGKLFIAQGQTKTGLIYGNRRVPGRKK
jgi:hypothetical protein